ncbi:MAG: class I SAM-dependent methyltransferase [Acetobacteraceae bacterium]
METTRAHWERIFTTRGPEEVSWFQPHLSRSLELIREAGLDPALPVIDIGGGASTLAGDLLAAGFSDVSVLDVSAQALARNRAGLGEAGGLVHWIEADITAWRPERHYGLWHDRAMFHFLREAAAQEAYLAALRAATVVGSVVVIAGFALDGPERCSGLPVARQDPAALAERLAPLFRAVAEAREEHVTPAGAVQRFVYTVFRREG